jgi:23S rRNA (cytosine1962-C5)-methyltransferase
MRVVLKPTKEKSLKKRHPWIFTGALKEKPNNCFGDIFPVFSASEEFLGHAFCNNHAPTIFGRMVSWGSEDPIASLKKSLSDSIQMRQLIKGSNAIRLVHAEADHLPGLIVDSYDGHLVLQIASLGMEKLKTQILEWLKAVVNPKSIYEKSTSASRKQEGMYPIERELFGTTPETILINEQGRLMHVHPKEGQKTGYFIDQRELRDTVQTLSSGKTVLNCFSYTGGFSVAALQGGARKALSLDSSAWALEQAEKNMTLNGFSHETLCADAFDYLANNPLPFDLVILDPPAFAKSMKDVSAAFKAYKTLNTLALSKMASNSILITCSCSHFIETPLFQKLLFEASLQANRQVKIIKKLEASIDHPMSLTHPESHYLKSFCLYVA